MKKFVALFFSFVVTFASPTFAASASFNGRMNAAVSSLISYKASLQGIAANDPKFIATSGAVGGALTAAAFGTAGVAVGTVTWPALLVAVGISAVVGGAVNLAANSATTWLFNSDKTVTVRGPFKDPQGTPVIAQLSVGGPYFSAQQQWVGSIVGVTVGDVAAEYLNSFQQQTCSTSISYSGTCVNLSVDSCSMTSITSYLCIGKGTETDKTTGKVSDASISFNVSYSSVGSPFGGVSRIYTTTKPSGTTSSIDKSTTSSTLSIDQALAALSDASKQLTLSSEMLAAATNAIWQNAAAQPGYTGVPYSATDPVTSSQVANWAASNPSLAPSIGDFSSSIASGGSSSVPMGSPSQIGQQAINPSQASQANTQNITVQVDLGPNPGIGSPQLEDTPTASMILQPLFNLFPSFKNFSVPQHSGECPKPAFDVFGKHLVMDSHCTLLEQQRTNIYNTMILVFVLAAIFIVMSA
jgi:hypothetical protein